MPEHSNIPIASHKTRKTPVGETSPTGVAPPDGSAASSRSWQNDALALSRERVILQPDVDARRFLTA